MSTREDFWAFSVRVYADADVPPACLTLQNDHGLDVNMLLYCCWLATHGAQLDTDVLERALTFAEPWSAQVVKPLRRARTWMKRDSSARAQLPADVYADLRESIKTIELEAERLQQIALEALTPPPAHDPVSDAEALSLMSDNLLRYVKRAKVTPDPGVRAQLTALISASTGIEAARAERALASQSVSGAADG